MSRPAQDRNRLPPRLLPVLHFAVAHLALTCAFAAVAFDPRGVSGFFYHSRMLAIVHLVTLGWITCSILGSLYLVGPIALRVHLPARGVDYVAFAFVAIGIVGMVAHFWLDETGGMAWSAATVAAGIFVAGSSVVPRLMRATMPLAIRAHVLLAFVNIAGAATIGVLIGFDKVYHFLPGFVLATVFAHAHLAAIGWAAMMVVGVAYRLLPMVLPAEMPSGRTLWLSLVLLEAGTIGLVITLLFRARFAWLFSLVIISGFAAFFGHVVWMLKHPRPRPASVRVPDPAVAHAISAFACLLLTCALGVWLSLAEPQDALRLAMAYGVLGLVGFLAQMVVGMEGRLLPLFAWYWAFANTSFKGPVISPHLMAWRGGEELVFVLWLFGVPALAGGLAFDAIPFVTAGAWSLLVAAVVESLNTARIVRHAFQTSSPLSSPRAIMSQFVLYGFTDRSSRRILLERGQHR